MGGTMNLVARVIGPAAIRQVQCGTKKISKNKNMDVELCNAKCLASGDFQYFAVQAGGSGCFCGNTYGRWGENKTEGACGKKCAGNTEEACGGPNLNRVYRVEQPLAGAVSTI